MRISPFFDIISKYSNDKTEVILMRKFLYMLAALLVLIGINTQGVEARTDVYATTYNGNSWYVDQDSVKRIGDVLNFTVYTTSGLSYKVTSSDSNYYNADVFYYNNKLVSDNGQSSSHSYKKLMKWPFSYLIIQGITKGYLSFPRQISATSAPKAMTTVITSRIIMINS